EAKTRATTAAASADGKWIAVLMDNRKLWLYDVAEHKLQLASVTGQGDISAVAFTGQDLLLVADRTDRVLEYRAADMSVQRRIAPSMSVFDRTFRYGIMPIYTICPKPGELYKTVTYILSDAKQQAKQSIQPEATKVGAEATIAADEGAEESDDAQPRGVDNPWSPVWSSAIFMAVMLALGCAYMQWQEF
ncbi:MAG: hypothetical protein K8R36_24585, partial [Planctomycetales bacterium]|nr:hypothetical protein [Planctomycetales bacterium]